MQWDKARDVKKDIVYLVKKLELHHIDSRRIICFRSYGSVSRARARIWSFPKVWQLALHIEPHYVIEVLSQHFDNLSFDDKKRVLIHELLHIPKNFSGSLLPHRSRSHRIDRGKVESLFKKVQL